MSKDFFFVKTFWTLIVFSSSETWQKWSPHWLFLLLYIYHKPTFKELTTTNCIRVCKLIQWSNVLQPLFDSVAHYQHLWICYEEISTTPMWHFTCLRRLGNCNCWALVLIDEVRQYICLKDFVSWLCGFTASIRNLDLKPIHLKRICACTNEISSSFLHNCTYTMLSTFLWRQQSLQLSFLLF